MVKRALVPIACHGNRLSDGSRIRSIGQDRTGSRYGMALRSGLYHVPVPFPREHLSALKAPPHYHREPNLA